MTAGVCFVQQKRLIQIELGWLWGLISGWLVCKFSRLFADHVNIAAIVGVVVVTADERCAGRRRWTLHRIYTRTNSINWWVSWDGSTVVDTVSVGLMNSNQLRQWVPVEKFSRFQRLFHGRADGKALIRSIIWAHLYPNCVYHQLFNHKRTWSVGSCSYNRRWVTEKLFRPEKRQKRGREWDR